METKTENNEHSSIRERIDLIISPSAITHLLEAAQWARFLSIIGFIFVAFMIAVSLSVGFIFSFIPSDVQQTIPISASLISIFYLGITAIYFFPVLFLFNFSRKTIRAIKYKNGDTIENAMKNLKRHYKFIGILTIITLTLYIIIILFAIIISHIL